MATTPTQRDPRGIVTPDAFEVSEALLGLPLARPNQRLVALLIDLAVIGFITLVTRSFALVLGVVAAVFFVRAGFKRTPVKGSVFGRAMRMSVGCLGFFIAGVTALVWSSCGADFSGSDSGPSMPGTVNVGSAAAQILGALAAAGGVDGFQDAETVEEAEAAAANLIEIAREMGIEEDAIGDFLAAAVPEDASWADQSDELFAGLLAGGAGAAGVVEPDVDIRDEVAGYTVDEALSAYAMVLAAGADADPDGAERRRVLEARLAEVVAADTLRALQARVETLEDANRDQQRDIERTTEALAEATSGGFFGWLRSIVDELGFGFGWASLYLTVVMSSWKGQTVGKRLMGIRVVRLDGEPITWWTAFERAGGYAAGFATGLLGFAQVYWDSNRQAIHDRIVGTVVVVDGAKKVTDWESAL